MDHRQSWDQFFLGLAEYISTRSKDPSTKVGAVIVTPNHRPVSWGFNGFPQKMADHAHLLMDREQRLSRTIHAEINALTFATVDITNCIMYCTLMPCDRCAVQLAQKGIIRVVCPSPTVEQSSRWGSAFDRTRVYVKEMNIELVEI